MRDANEQPLKQAGWQHYLQHGLRNCIAALLLPFSISFADQQRTLLGVITPLSGSTPGKLSIDLDTLRRRGGHYEIWSHLTFPGEEMNERRTLWALRCRTGTMAKILEAHEGQFSPRESPLRFYLPSPESASAALIAEACREIMLRATAKDALQSPRSPYDAANQTPPATQPPNFLDPAGLDDNED